MKKAKRIFNAMYYFFSSLVLFVFTLFCFYAYLAAQSKFLMFVMMVATILWFYAFLIEIGTLLGFLKGYLEDNE